MPWLARPPGSPMPTVRCSRTKPSRRTRPGSGRACRSTTRRSTRCRAAPRRSRPRSSWLVPSTWRVARPIVSSCSAAGGATTGIRSGRSTCRAGSRSVARMKAGSAASATSARRTRTGLATRVRTPSRRPTSSRPSSSGRSSRPGRVRSQRSSPSRSWGPPWPGPCHRTGTGRRSPRSAGGTASC